MKKWFLKIRFLYNCHRIESVMEEHWYGLMDGHYGEKITFGLCVYIGEQINRSARTWFEDNFRDEATSSDNLYWLGSNRTREGYENRLKYLKMFKKKALETEAYMEWYK